MIERKAPHVALQQTINIQCYTWRTTDSDSSGRVVKQELVRVSYPGVHSENMWLPMSVQPKISPLWEFVNWDYTLFRCIISLERWACVYARQHSYCIPLSTFFHPLKTPFYSPRPAPPRPTPPPPRSHTGTSFVVRWRLVFTLQILGLVLWVVHSQWMSTGWLQTVWGKTRADEILLQRENWSSVSRSNGISCLLHCIYNNAHGSRVFKPCFVFLYHRPRWMQWRYSAGVRHVHIAPYRCKSQFRCGLWRLPYWVIE